MRAESLAGHNLGPCLLSRLPQLVARAPASWQGEFRGRPREGAWYKPKGHKTPNFTEKKQTGKRLVCKSTQQPACPGERAQRSTTPVTTPTAHRLHCQ